MVMLGVVIRVTSSLIMVHVRLEGVVNRVTLSVIMVQVS